MMHALERGSISGAPGSVQGAWQELGEQAAALADERRAFRRAMRLIRRHAALATAQPSGVLVRLDRL